MGDLHTSALNSGGRTWLIYEYTIIYKRPMPVELKRGWAYNTSRAYNIYYTVDVKQIEIDVHGD